MVGMSTSLTQDVPPYVILSGNPAQAHGINSEGLKRRGFSREAITAIRHAYKLLYKSGLTLEEAKAALHAQEQSEPEFAVELKLIRDFLQNVSRGIVR
jgi:UDP-N-acetylglucosamine acyltransferase